VSNSGAYSMAGRDEQQSDARQRQDVSTTINTQMCSSTPTLTDSLRNTTC